MLWDQCRYLVVGSSLLVYFVCLFFFNHSNMGRVCMSFVLIQKCSNRSVKSGGHMPLSEFKLNQENELFHIYVHVCMYICMCRGQAPYDTCVCIYMHACVCISTVCICICECDSITTVPFPERRFLPPFLDPVLFGKML